MTNDRSTPAVTTNLTLLATAALDALALPAGQLTAAADPATRTVEGIIVPWGEAGRTNLGSRAVRRGALSIGDRVIGITGHDRDRPVSRLIAHEDRPEGLWGRLRIAETPSGDQLIAEVRDGIRDGLSIEASDLLFDQATGDVVGGRVDFVAHVSVPAYASAQVHTLTATAAIPSATPGSTVVVNAPPLQAAPPIDYGQLAAALAPHLTHATAPAGLPTGGLPGLTPSPGLAPSAGATPDQNDPLTRAATLQATIFRSEGTPELVAELNDITNTGLSIFQSPTGSLGEKLWEGASYSRRFVGYMRQRPLTSWKFGGWQWIERPRVQDYLGDKKDVPSNPVSVDQVEGKARRLAGAWDIDRKFVDFGDAEFWTELYTATTESYLEESDQRAALALIEYAFDITVAADYPTLSDGETPAYKLPRGYATGAGGLIVAQQSVLQAVALGTAVLKDTPRVRQAPDYVMMNTFDFLSLAELTGLDLPAFLGLLKVDPNNFDSHAEVPRGQIILGVRNAATYRELGSTPIRVSALNIPKGGVDEGVFGYTGISMDRPGGIISVPLAAAAG